VDISPGSKRLVLSDQRHIVVRMHRPGDVTVNRPAQEIAWARRCGEVITVQLPLTDDLVHLDGATGSLWAWVEGRPLSAGDAFAHGQLLRTLHDGAPLAAHERETTSDQLASARRRLTAMGSTRVALLLTGLVDIAHKRLKMVDAGDVVLAHGDAHDRNLLVGKSGLVLLDFDTTGPQVRTIDVAYGLYSYRKHLDDPRAPAAFLAGYGPHPRLDPKTLELLVTVRHLRAAVTRASQGHDVETRVAFLAERLR
jgi:Ser/Thr protein kinase RdoA (MazF antagonist)